VRTLVEIVDPQAGMSVYDPTCGSGGMLIQTRDYIRECRGDPRDLTLAGQESIGTTWSICKMNMLLHGIPHADIRQEDTIRHPQHKADNNELKQLKADLRATEKKKEDLVAAAREKISRDEARRVILDRLHRLLVQTYEGYLRADQRACLTALENLWSKYAVTGKAIEAKRDTAASKLKAFLAELRYD
jgi:hypothetical protein